MENLNSYGITNSKLVEYDVRTIIEFHYVKKLTVKQIAGLYQVSRDTISRILHGRAWKYVYEDVRENGFQDNRDKRDKLECSGQ